MTDRAAKGFVEQFNTWRCQYFGHMPPMPNWLGVWPRSYVCARCGERVIRRGY